MAIVKNNNNGAVSLFRNEFDNLFDNFLSSSIFDDNNSLVKTSLSPKVNVSENDNEYVVEAEMPGVSKDNIEISYANDVLTLKAERKEKTEEKKKNYHRIESHFGSMQRSIHIPKDIEDDKIDAKFENGILHITLPKTEKAKNIVKKISVK